jgi:hypothetical protein
MCYIDGQKNKYSVILICLKNSNQIKEDEVGRACSPNRGKDKYVYVIGWKARGKETTRKTKT